MNKVINISSNGIKQAIDDLVNENELLQDKIYKQNEEIERLKKNQKLTPEERDHLHLELDEIVGSLQLENERLNNIINEFDKWLENINIGELDDFFIGVKLSELKKAWNDIKGSDKE